MNIIKRTSTVNTNYYPNRSIKYIVIHYTAGTSSKSGNAVANADWFNNPSAGASADFIVDDVQFVQKNPNPRNYYCWAVGGSKYSGTKGGSLYGTALNSNCISIEMCSTNKTGRMTYPNDPNYYLSDATYKNAVALCQYLMKEYGIDANHVIRHYDVNGKPCPGILGWGTNGGDNSTWLKFKKEIGGTITTTDDGNQTAVTPIPTVNFTYAVQCVDGTTGTDVTNLGGYAGIRGKKIANIRIKTDIGSVKYRVHVLGGKWLPWVTGYDWADYENGYAGIGKAIDAVQVIYIKPSGMGYQEAQYRVSPMWSNYYDWQYNTNTDNGQDGYAGCMGKAIDRFQLF